MFGGVSSQKERLSDPCRSLQILESFNCRQRSKIEWYGGIEHVTETVTYPCGCADMLQRFSMPLLVLSVATNTVLDYMYGTHGHFLTGQNPHLLCAQALEEYTQAIAGKGSPLQNCIGFIDGTVRLI